MYCYNCNKVLSPAENRREHIPARCHFYGYRKDKFDRITVPACFNCNNSYSQIDQELRDAAGVTREENEIPQLTTEKSVRSVLRNPSWRDRVKFDMFGYVRGVNFKISDFKMCVAKDFKGLIYHQFQEPIIEDNWKILVVTEMDNKNAINKAIPIFANFLENQDCKASGLFQVFAYKSVTPTKFEKGKPILTDNLNDPIFLSSYIIYHRKFQFLVLAAKKDYFPFLNKI